MSADVPASASSAPAVAAPAAEVPIQAEAADDSSAAAAPPKPDAASEPPKRAKRGPLSHMDEYRTDTIAQLAALGDREVEEPEYSAAELAQMEQLRAAVAAMMQDPAQMVASADDYPGGMWQHWTNYWPEGAGHTLFEDRWSQADADPATWPQHELIRFLRARDMNLKKSTKMYFAYRRWRLLYGVSHIAALPTMPFEPLIATILCHSYHKLDKHGRPLYLQKSGLINPNRFTKEVSLEQIGIGHTWFSEEVRKRCELGSRLTGKRITELVNIIDIKGLGLNARKLLKIFSTTIFIDQNFYPETLGTLYLINAPAFFPAIYSICKTFLSQKTQTKVKILGSNFAPTLLEDLGAECLPVEYGGSCACEGGCVPVPSGVAPKNAGDDDEESFTLKAGARHSLELPYVPVDEDGGHQQLWWGVELASRDVDYSVEFRATPSGDSIAAAAGDSDGDSDAAAAVESEEVQGVTRVVHGTAAGAQGSFSSDKAGVLVFTFSNEHARWHSKHVKLRSGCRSVEV